MKVACKDFAKGKKGVYNPNSYGYLDAGISFMAFMVFFVIVWLVFRLAINNSGAFKDYIKSDYYFNIFFSTLISQGAIILFAFVYSRIRKVSLFSGGGYAFKWNFLDITMACVLAFGLFFVLQVVHMYIAENFAHIFGETAINESDIQGNENWAYLYVFICTPLLPAFCEEAFMRGIVARSMEKFGIIFAIIVSGFAFGIFHGNPQQLFLQSISGMAMALVYFATKNFVVPMAMHAFHNLFSALNEASLLTLNETSSFRYYWADTLIIFVGIICCIIGLIYFIKKLLKKKKDNQNISLKPKVYLLNTTTNVITEEYAYKVEEYTTRLDNGELFLNGNNFISKNKLGNKVVGFVLICASLVLGCIDVFIGLESLILLMF